MADSSQKIIVTEPSEGYELLDSGEGRKLERYGNIVISRPDPQALWKISDPEKWKTIDASFERSNKDEDPEGEVKGRWIINKETKVSFLDKVALASEKWNISYDGLTLRVRLTPFKHTGLFPEQIVNWQWSEHKIHEAIGNGNFADKKPTVLNLFGYTGGASLVAARGGAAVTHVDASRSSITWANENAASSDLQDAPIRWILEDAQNFVAKEVRRGASYDAIIMDPPAFGRGAKGELWRIEKDFLNLLDNCMKILSKKPLFFIINGYAAGYSPIAYENNLKELVKKYGGTIESGELAIRETGPEKRLLPAGIVSRWSA